MSLFSKLFGGGSGGGSASAASETYEGFSITPEPIKESGGFRICARIEKEIGGEVKTHQMIRADTLESAEAAATASVGKAKVLIDQQGEGIFK